MTGIPSPPICPRCDQPAEAEWHEATTFADPEPTAILGRAWCATPGCVDEFGSNNVNPPPTPAELLDRAHHAWMARHLALTKEQA